MCSLPWLTAEPPRPPVHPPPPFWPRGGERNTHFVTCAATAISCRMWPWRSPPIYCTGGRHKDPCCCWGRIVFWGGREPPSTSTFGARPARSSCCSAKNRAPPLSPAACGEDHAHPFSKEPFGPPLHLFLGSKDGRGNGAPQESLLLHWGRGSAACPDRKTPTQMVSWAGKRRPIAAQLLVSRGPMGAWPRVYIPSP